VAFVNPLAAALATAALLYYVFVYTLWLKRRTYHSVTIGGAAGAFPPVVGWVAVTGQLDLLALVLFAIVFFWTPPHAWALVLLVKEDYQQVRVPMLPAIWGPKETAWQILLYSCVLVAITLVPVAAQVLGPVYLVAAVLLGGLFVALAGALWRTPSKRWSRLLYKYSSYYLALLFLAVVLDRSR
jgi:protoheme IX farnesyltransferase